MPALQDKIAIVTGATSGIGRATAKLFAAEGAKVVATGRREAELATLAEEIGADGRGAIAIVAGDVRDERFADVLVDRAVDRFGGLDVAVNNAGIVGALAPVTELSTSTWRDVLATNLDSGFFGARSQLPAMAARGGGSLIFVSTFVGRTVGFPGMSAYAASKAGLIGMMQVIAAEFGPRGIRVNALLPGGTDTDAARAVADTPQMRSFIDGLHALKRQAAPEEIASAALFLASDSASFVTGSAMRVDGGVSINRT